MYNVPMKIRFLLVYETYTYQNMADATFSIFTLDQSGQDASSSFSLL